MADLLPCIQWMNPYAITLREAGPVELKFFPMVHIDDSHNVQTHAVDLDLLVSFNCKFLLSFLYCGDALDVIHLCTVNSA